MSENYNSFLQCKRAQFGDKFDASGLAPEFVQYFQSGERIKVDMVGLDGPNGNDVYGHTVITGTVSVTTGWKPSFMLMTRSSNTGSPWLLSSHDRIVAVKCGRTYREVR